MLVSHESPLALMDQSLSYNDYDYCLVHLLPQHSNYLNFFLNSKKNGRRILLDNSMFELRTAFQADIFAEWVNKILPYEYIVPDVFNDYNKTIESFNDWLKLYNNLPGKKIGVIQGKTYKEMVTCYKYMSSFADKIAISFEAEYFHNRGYSTDSNACHWHHLMCGRINFIKDLIRDGIWAWNKPHHLLGSTLPQEFKEYNGIVNIESIDTSNPVVAGLHNVRYNDDGLHDKITTKLADLIEANVSEENWNNISFNIKRFREINKIGK